MPHYSDQELAAQTNELYFQIAEKRKYGFISCAVKSLAAGADRSDPQFLIAGLLKELGFIPVALDEIEDGQARRIFNLILSRDLAYRVEIMSQEEANQLAERFLAFFEPPVRYFTNGYFTENPFYLRSWDPISKATFDTGVVVLSETRIGLLWAEDED